MIGARLGFVVVFAACDTPELAGVVTRVDHGFDPDAMAVADVDRDGLDDMVAVSGGLRTIGIAWGGAGQVTRSLAEEAAGVAIGDFDGDGRLDVATALPADDAVAVLLGQGGRELAAERRIAVGAGPRAVLAIQLDEDAAHEMVVANTVDGTVSVLHELVAGPAEVVGAGPRGLAAGDIDGDGDQDVAVALADVDRVHLLLGTGDGKLMPGPAHAVGAAPRAVVIAELDGEAGLDLATLDALGATVSVLRGDGAGGLRGRDMFATPPHPVALAVVRRDADRSRIAVLSREADTVIEIDAVSGPVLRGRAEEGGALASVGGELYIGGVGRVAPLETRPGLQFEAAWTGPVASAIQSMDLDGDGVDEVVIALGLAGALEWWREGVKIGGVDPGLGAVFTGIHAVDMDGDGRRDLIAWSANSVAVALAAQDGTFTPGAPLRFEDEFAQVLVGDADGDGDSDLLIFWSSGEHSRIDTYAVTVGGTLVHSDSLEFTQFLANLQLVDFGGGAAVDLMWNSSGVMAIAEDAGRGPLWFLPPVDVLADLDGEGALDGVYCDLTTLRVYHDYLSGANEPEDVGQTRCGALEVRDLDGDGRTDILVETYAPSAYELRLRLEPWINTGDGFVALTGETVVKHSGCCSRIYSLANLDNDAAIDMILRDEEDRVVAMRGEQRLVLAEGGPRGFGGGGGDVLVDIDDDGATDLVSVGLDVVVAPGDGHGGFGPAVTHELGGQVRGVIRVDFEGDGRDEIVSYEQTFGTLLRLAFTDESLAWQPLPAIGLYPGTLTGGDVDGDGIVDVVFYSRNGGIWTVLRGHGDGSFDSPIWGGGMAGEVYLHLLTVADTDGDGQSELIASSGNWVSDPVLANTAWLWRGRWTAEHAFTFEQWLPGLNPTEIVMGDVDGDFVPDAAVVLGSSLVLVPGRGAAGPPWRGLLDGVGRVAIGDVDGDGPRELVVVGKTLDNHSEHAGLRIGRRAAEGWVFTDQDVPIRGAVESLEVRDLDTDGAPEIVLTDRHGATIVRLP